MAPRDPDAPAPNARAPYRSSALALGGGSLLALFVMTMHPSLARGDLAATTRELARLAGPAGAVHGMMIGLLGVVLFGQTGLSAALGWSRAAVRAGLVAAALGAVALMGAAVGNGFVAPRLAERWEDVPPAELESLRASLSLLHLTTDTLAVAGSLATLIAILAWSGVLLGRGRSGRALGGLGLVAGGAPALLLVTGALTLDVRGMGLVLLAQAVWNTAAALWLAASRAPAADAVP